MAQEGRKKKKEGRTSIRSNGPTCLTFDGCPVGVGFMEVSGWCLDGVRVCLGDV